MCGVMTYVMKFFPAGSSVQLANRRVWDPRQMSKRKNIPGLVVLLTGCWFSLYKVRGAPIVGAQCPAYSAQLTLRVRTEVNLTLNPILFRCVCAWHPRFRWWVYIGAEQRRSAPVSGRLWSGKETAPGLGTNHLPGSAPPHLPLMATVCASHALRVVGGLCGASWRL